MLTAAHAEDISAQLMPASLKSAAEPAVLSMPPAPAALVRAGRVVPDTDPLPVPQGLRGWEHLYRLLVSEGMDANRIAELLRDRRLPARETLYFSLNPKESKHLYRRHNTRRARKNALAFYSKHLKTFQEAERVYGVPQRIILAILQVETSCGKVTGRTSIFYRLARLAAAGDPENVLRNYLAKKQQDADLRLADVQARAQWLQEEFLPHVAATVKLADTLNLHPFEIRGSNGGALGLPQFLPGNIEKFGADGNGDKRIDLYDPEDAIHSVARYLREHGWKPEPMGIKAQRKVIWAYNRSDSYIDTVLAMAAQLEAPRKKLARS